MATILPSIDRILDPVAACLTPEVAQRIVDVRVDDPLMMERLEHLREKANDGTLAEADREEYEDFVEANDVLTLLKDKARSLLVRNG
jgi:BioD-like phosphotransacetylase family protein